MSRYAGYPPWVLLLKAAILPIILYLTLCLALSDHYRTLLDRYDDAAQSIAAGWPELRNFNAHSICEVDRLNAAGAAAASYHPFDAWWMIRNWNTDFLAQQPPCK